MSESSRGCAKKKLGGRKRLARPEGQKSAGQLGSLQASVNALQKQLSSFEATQRTTNQKLNARISALAQRVNSIGG